MITTVPMTAKIPLILEPQPEGGWTVTSPVLPELLTEGDSIEEIRENVQDCFAGLVEMYEDDERPLPPEILNYDDHTELRTPHISWTNPHTGKSTFIPDRGDRDLKIRTLRSAVRQLGIDWQDFIEA